MDFSSTPQRPGLDPQDIRLVRDSFALVAPIAPQAAEIFYTRLFALDPALRQLFRSDMVGQGERLMTMIGAAVRLLDRPAQLHGVLRGLGARHVGYGVEAGHYATVGTALLDTLATGLGPAFTADVRQAWTRLYGAISQAMQAGACEAAGQAGRAAVEPSTLHPARLPALAA